MPDLTVPRASGVDPAPSSSPAGAVLLGFAAGGKRWLVDPRQDVQVIDAAITPVPLTLPWFLGLVLLGQRLIAAVDLAGLGGAEVGARKSVERLLLLPERWHTALRVERVYGLREVAGLRVSDASDASDAKDVGGAKDANDAHHSHHSHATQDAHARSVQAPPAPDAVLPGCAPWCGPMLADADGTHWQVLDVAQLCTSPAFLQAGIPLAA